MDAPVNKDSVVPVTDSVKVPETQVNPAATDLEMFQNIEQVDFCIPLPLKDYPLDETEKRERAHFLFKSKKNKEYAIDVQGMFRSDPAVKIGDYFANSYTEEDEASGKVIVEKKLIPGTRCFYAKGFWSNLGDKQRFIEVTWLRKEDVVKLYADFPIADTTLWSERLKQLVETDSYCK